ncbi:type VI secretion system tube protein Hcp [Bradyrhizobium guangdongense]|uniref:Cadherin-like domain-containing protein n=4 Tax=Bradyrhizobium guangdongense TaxID=1325090 RepID=A0ABX6UDC9_9BRAD|nr:type VI secretion system tube protein Hcp [Bradyrhizobium guangdongense]QAU38253.1 hypothetical protein X265_11575 [Bradyrhizobium guangdongense]QOZ59306.1 hypothetical protein XH86_11570 [Bradyrhizobium guangdongense]
MSDSLASWNRIKNISGFSDGVHSGPPLAAPLTLPASGVAPDSAGASLDYYVRFSMYDGTTFTVDGNKLFGLHGFSFSDDQTLNIGSQSTGAGAGKVTFNPLHLSFSQLGLDPKLFQMLASGTAFKEVDVLGYHESGDTSHLAVDYSFGLAAAKTLGINDSGITTLDLEYGAEAMQIFNQHLDGSYSSTPDATSSWNRIKNISGFSDGVHSGPPLAAPLTLPASGVAPDSAGASLDYYVRFSMYDGTTFTVDGNKLFGLHGFSFSDDQTLNIGSQSTGAGAGKVTFNPLHLSFSQLGLDPKLFQMLASGTAFKEVDVLGYHESGDTSHLAVDYSFGLAAAKTLGINDSGITTLDLEYGAEAMQIFNQHLDGSYSSTPDATSSWNRIKNISGFSDGVHSGPPLAAPLTLPASGVAPDSAGASLDYYVRFSMYDGTTFTVDGNKLFGLHGFSFSDDQTLNIGSQSTGAGAGKVTFNPLHLSFSQLGLDPKLFQMLASGTAFKEVDVLGYHESGDTSHLAVDYSFGLAAAKTLGINDSGITTLDLEYGAEAMQIFNQHLDGSYSSTPDATSSWNRIKNISGFSDGVHSGPPLAAPLTLPASGVAPDSAGASLDYYVRFSMYDGTTFTVDGNKLFGLHGFSFSDDQTLNIGSQSTGAGAGKVTFNPLHLSFSQLGLDPKLFQMLASGTAFKEVDVLGYHESGDTSHLAVDYSFGLAAAKTLGVNDSGITTLDLEYGAEAMQIFNQHLDGSYSSTPDATSSWNRIKNISGFSDGVHSGPPLAAPLKLPASGVAPDSAGASLDYYVRFSMYDGTTFTVDGNKLFGLHGFSFSDDQTLNIGSQSSGAGAGKVTFNPLHLSFSQLGLDPKLFQMLASGTAFKEVDVLGYHESGDTSHLAVDYSFGLAAAKTLGINDSGITTLDLEYGAEAMQIFNQHLDGSYSSTPDATSSWNRIKNISGFSDGVHSGPPLAAPLTLPASGVAPDSAGASLDYYVRFSMYDGTTFTVDGNKLFGLHGFSFSDDQTLNIGSQSTGAGAGKVTFNPLHLSFSQLGLDPKLFQMLASGTAFKEVDVLGYHESGDTSHLAVDYSFGLAAAKTLGVNDSGITTLDLEYGAEAIHVFDLNQAPVALYGSATGNEDNSISGHAIATDPDQLPGPITYSLVSSPQHGTIDFHQDGSFVFTPTADFNGTDSFTFQSSDGDLTSNVATFKLNVREVNDAPIANADVKTTTENSKLVFAASDLIANDVPGPTNEADQHLKVTSVSATPDTHGRVSLVGGQVIFTPDKDYIGGASFNYTVTDDGTTDGRSDPQSSSGIVSINVLSTKNLTYLLKVDGIQGDSTVKGYEGAFTVDEFTFNELTKLAAGAGGGGAGKAQFDPLTVDIGRLSAGLVKLLADAATGRHIPTIELVGLKPQGDALQKLYDLKLTDATVAGFASDGGHDTAIAFDFNRGSETIAGQNADGSLNAGQTFNFTAGPLAPVDHDILTAFAHDHSGPQLTYLLKVDGIQGDSTVKGYEGAFTVDEFTFNELTKLAAGAGGGGAGKAQFDPLTVDIGKLSAGLVKLLADAATGRHIPTIELVGLKPQGDALQKLYDLKLTDATVAGFASDGGHDTAIAFDFNRGSETIAAQNADGSLNAGQTFNFTAGPLAPVDHNILTAFAHDHSGPQLTYLLKVDGIQGDSTVKGYEGAFTVDEFTFNELTKLAAGSGAGAGKAQFDPLTVDIGRLSAGLVKLLADAATGRHIPTIELVGLKPQGDALQKLYDLKLTDATVAGFASDGGHDTAIAFDFNRGSETIAAQNADGSLKAGQTFNFTAGPLAPVDHNILTAFAHDHSGPQLTYLLKVDGIQGDSTVKGYEGAFTVDEFTFNELTKLAAGAGGGGAGKAQFDPLTVDIGKLSAGLVKLLADAATGRHIPTIELVGLKPQGDALQKLYDLKLTDATVAGFASDGGHDTAIAFDFNRGSETIAGQNADGSLNAGQTFNFTAGPLAPVDHDILTAFAHDHSGPQLTYLLKVDGIQGDSTVKGYEGAFTVDEFTFNELTKLAAGAGGGGAGKAQFDPLTVDIGKLSAGLVKLLADAATGRHIPTIELVGLKPQGDALQKLYDLKLTDATVAGFASDGGHDTAIAFDFNRGSETIAAQNADGSLNAGQTFNFTAGPLAPVDHNILTAFAHDHSGPQLTYLLKVDGIQGDSTVKGYEGAFTVDEFTFNELTKLAAGSGAGAGKAQFDPLTVDIGRLSAGLVKLLADAATGRHIPTIELVGLKPQGDALQKLYDLKLTDATVAGFASDGGHDTAIAFDFNRGSETIAAQNADGSLKAGQTFNFTAGPLAPVDHNILTAFAHLHQDLFLV